MGHLLKIAKNRESNPNNKMPNCYPIEIKGIAIWHFVMLQINSSS